MTESMHLWSVMHVSRLERINCLGGQLEGDKHSDSFKNRKSILLILDSEPVFIPDPLFDDIKSILVIS